MRSYSHSFDVCTECCIYCGGDRMDANTGKCHGELKNFRETLVITQATVSWVRTAKPGRGGIPVVSHEMPNS